MALASLKESRAFAYLSERGEDALYAVKDALGGTGSSQYLDMSEEKLARIRTQLESTHDEDRLEGMRRVVALISKGRDATPFLASVLKLSSTSSLEVRKLVYIVVLRYAPSHPDLTLLSINSFQRDLSDPNPLIRGMALRALSGIRVRAVSAIVLLAVGKATRDPHPYVRRVATFALTKCYHMDHGQYDTLLEHISTFFQDRSPSVLGPAMCAFGELCPDRWELLHRHFRKFCLALSDMDEWSLPTCTQILTRYARMNLPKPDHALPMDEDLQLLLSSLQPLLHNTNPAVVMASIHAQKALQPEKVVNLLPPLIRLVHSAPDVAYMALINLLTFAESHAANVAPYLTSLLVRASDPAYVAQVKLRILVLIVQASDISMLAHELAMYTRFHAVSVATDSVTALGQLATSFSGVASTCLQLLMEVVQDATIPVPVLSRAVQVIKTLLRVSPDKVAAQIVAQFAVRLFVPLATYGHPKSSKRIRILTDPTSRAAVLWMLGQYSEAPFAGATILTLLIPDVLRCLVAHWDKEDAKVQCQALALSSKVFVLMDHLDDVTLQSALPVLHYELLARASRCANQDVRERGRFYSGLTRGLNDAENELEAAPSDEIREYIASHRALDQMRLPGVRLRREQVQHVLFARDQVEASSLERLTLKPITDDNVTCMSTFADGMHLRGWKQAQWPAWRDKADLPPAIVRAQDASSLAAGTNAQKTNTWLDEQRSFSSDTYAIKGKQTEPEKVVLEPRTSTRPSMRAPTKARYEDLDSFFNSDEDEDTESLGEPAPEDDEYEAEEVSSSDLDDD